MSTGAVGSWPQSRAAVSVVVVQCSALHCSGSAAD
jgi:hypothetical protein